MVGWVSAIRQRLNVFLQAGRQATLRQWRLVYLPFVDRSHDWVQPETGVAIDKNILGFSRSLKF